MVRLSTFFETIGNYSFLAFMVRFVQLFMNVYNTIICCRCNFFDEILSETIATQNFPDFSQNFEAENYAAKFLKES